MDWRYRTAAVVLCAQLLLVFHTYRSTDFEVHRNWLAITYSLPISQWYYEATSEWTLDYPPLFAWFEWVMAKVAVLFDPSMLKVSNLEHASDATVLFQRLSVCVTSFVLVTAMLKATESSRDSAKGLTAFALVVCNAGLIMVDNIHFQYNSILMGILVYSVLLLEEQRYVFGGVLFAVLLNMKHLFAYLAPVYFVFLLKHFVLTGSSTGSAHTSKGSNDTGSASGGGLGRKGGSSGSSSFSWPAALGRLMLLGGSVLAVCGVSFGPFVVMGQMQQVLSRLFPFARGLCHAYWAPNAWALYSFVDKVAAAAGTKAGLLRPTGAANMAGGIVGVSSYIVLPNIAAGVTALCVLLAMVPCLVALWAAPKGRALALVTPAIAYANLCGFMFGYHVHEKAALTVEIPMALAAVRSSDWGQQYMLLSTAAHVGIFSLLYETQEVPIRWLLAVVYYIICVWGLSTIHMHSQASTKPGAGSSTSSVGGDLTSSAVPDTPSPVGVRTRRQQAQKQQGPVQQHLGVATPAKAPRAAAADAGPGVVLPMHQCCSWLPLSHRLYLAGFVVLELYCTLGHTALLGSRLPFVPLMLTSVYCAVGFTWVWGWMALWFVRQCVR